MSQVSPNWWRTGRSLPEIAERLENIAQLSGKSAGRHQAESAARDKLLKDELERKILELQLELKQERQRLGMRIKKMEFDLAHCLCRKGS